MKHPVLEPKQPPASLSPGSVGRSCLWRKGIQTGEGGAAIRRTGADALPDFVPPQLTALAESAPEGGEWAHDLKWDGYRMHARGARGGGGLLTRGGLDWTEKYPAIVEALRALTVAQAYLDGELCALSETG